MSNAPLRRIPAGAVVFREGEAAESAYIVESGAIDIVRRAGHDRIVLARLGPGEIFGEMALIDGSPRSATAIAACDTDLTEISGDQIRQRLAQADPLVVSLLRVVLARFKTSRRDLSDRTEAVEIKTAPAPEHPGYSEALSRLRLEGALKQAIPAAELFLLFQPIVDLRRRDISGFEALVRWRHGGRGTISPGDFVPLAEESGLIGMLDRWVLRDGFAGARLLAEAAAAEAMPPYVAINLSGQTLQDPAVVRLVGKMIEETGVAPSQVVLEVTERVFMADADRAAAILADLKRLDVRLALDDFGSGYSSLTYLDRLAVDILKLDGGLVGGIGERPRSRALVESVIRLAHELGMIVVAEGVEGPEQAAILREIGCDAAQGYFLSEPLDHAGALAAAAAKPR
ncbi:MAG TPA: EAL domain-containing protein [Alphaproteobacteria bacterium]|nr:EAL domain-containing protein [Alphaproteobacteria bacterium]